jgi:DNA-binding MarR family transcriptional regulator
MGFSALQRTGLALKRLQHRHHVELDARLRGIGTTLSQWDALRHVARSPGASTRELAALTFMTDQSFGALAIKLAEQGLVKRTPGQGRVVHHVITNEGEVLLEKATVIADEVLGESFAPLSEADRATLEALLNRVLEGWAARRE